LSHWKTPRKQKGANNKSERKGCGEIEITDLSTTDLHKTTIMLLNNLLTGHATCLFPFNFNPNAFFSISVLEFNF
jgi:hypothetical protein